MISLKKIKGDSLFPIYKDGQIVLSISCKYFKAKENDIVVFSNPSIGLMVKKVDHIKVDSNNKKQFFLLGTNPYSIDSRNFGYIEESMISSKVLFAIK